MNTNTWARGAHDHNELLPYVLQGRDTLAHMSVRVSCVKCGNNIYYMQTCTRVNTQHAMFRYHRFGPHATLISLPAKYLWSDCT